VKTLAFYILGALLVMAPPMFSDAESSRASGATIRPVSPVSVSGTVDTEFDVQVEVGNAVDLFGVSFELNFDKAHLNAISETSEPFLGGDILFFPQHDNTNGKVSIGISKKAGQGGSSGTGNVARIRFKVVQGVTQDTPAGFSLSAVTANDPSGNPINLSSDSSTTILTGTATSAVLSVIPTTWLAPSGGGTSYAVGVTNSGTGGAISYTVSDNADWLSTSALSGSTPGSFTITATANVGGSSRTGTVTVTATSPSRVSNSPQTITVTQPASQGSGASIRPVGPVSVNGTVDTEFDVQVEVGDVVDLFGVSFELNFDKAHLNALSETSEPFLGGDILFFPQHDNANGKVSIGISKKAGQGGSSGTGNVAKIRFKVVQGVTEDTPVDFTLSAVTANDPSGNPINLSPGSSTTILTFIQDDVTNEPRSSIPSAYALYQNHPNPFNPTTRIRYALPEGGNVELRVYDGLGRVVATLVEGRLEAGEHEEVFDAKRLSSGLYYCRLQAGSRVMTKKLLLLR
jgi:hypothetical protein